MTIKPDLVLTPAILQPSIYVFWLGERCQYVGQSKHGLRRPLDIGHAVWSQHEGFSFDRLEVFYTDVSLLDSTERKMIQTLAPRFNTAHHPVHQHAFAVKNLLNKCEIAMLHEQDKLADAPDPAKVQRVYNRAAREIINLVNFR